MKSKHLSQLLGCALALATLMCLHPARAELTKLIESSRGTAVYVDAAKIDRTTDPRQLEELWNFREADQFGNFSTRIQAEYDCKVKMRRILAVTGYPAQMWQGKPSGPLKNTDTNWKPVGSNTLAEAIMRGVCLQ